MRDPYEPLDAVEIGACVLLIIAGAACGYVICLHTTAKQARLEIEQARRLSADAAQIVRDAEQKVDDVTAYGLSVDDQIESIISHHQPLETMAVYGESE